MNHFNIYVIRHGQTLFNKLDLAQGWCDSPLTKEGKEEARKLKEKLNHIHFKKAFSSTSERAMDTAQIVLEDKNMIVQQSKLLKEYHFGHREGQQNAYLDNQAITLKKQLEVGWRHIDGENKSDVEQRLELFIAQLLDQRHYGDIAIFTHGLTIITLVSMIDESIAFGKCIKGGLKNCSVTQIEVIGNKLKVKMYNNELI